MDIISHCIDLDALRVTIAKNPGPIFTIDEEGLISIKTLQTPAKVNGNESISIVNGFTPEQLEEQGLICLGNVDGNGDYAFFNDTNQATYERVRGSLEVQYVDDYGVEKTHRRSYKIGVIG
jgi:hypothetical protein